MYSKILWARLPVQFLLKVLPVLLVVVNVGLVSANHMPLPDSERWAERRQLPDDGLAASQLTLAALQSP